MVNRTIINSIIAGVLIGLLLYHNFLLPKPQTLTKIIETVTTDTIYVHQVDTVTITKTDIKHEFLRDTVYMNTNIPISNFKTYYAHVYGSIDISGQVMGEVLSMGLKTDLRIPTVTNTIERTETIIKKPQGLYLGAGVNSNLSAVVGGYYLNDQFIYGYQFNPFFQQHQIFIGRKLF